MTDIYDVEPGETIEIRAAMRVEQPTTLAPHDDAQPVALGKVEPPRAVDPDMLECLLFDRPELASMLRVVRHLQFPHSRRAAC
jgi:hypothetical protein